MPIFAKFSNGHVDAYKGTRPVKAAWMITDRATGRVLASGHSATLEAARKTADGATAQHHTAGSDASPIWAPRGHTAGHIKVRADAARREGWDGRGNCEQFIRKENARRKALRDASVAIEVVAI